jgi:hypothetical protein
VAWFAQLLIPQRRKNLHDLEGRTAQVIAQVLFDIGVDRFLNGTMLVDRRLRVRFVSAAPDGVAVHASVHPGALAQAQSLRGDSAGMLASPPHAQQVERVVEALMAAFLAQSPVLRALPARRYRMPERSAAASK